jgi:hypothetical protein
MPTVFYYFGLQFLFYSNDHEPIHVHVQNADGEAKFKIEPICLIENRGLKNKDLKLAEIAIEENKEVIIERWKEFFKEKK